MNASPTTLLAGLRALPRPAWVLFFGTFLNKFGAFVVPFLTLYLTRQGYTVTEAGVAVGAYGVGGLFASLLGGYLADELGRRQTIALSMFAGAATMMLLSQAHHFALIVGLTALAGLASEFYRPASSALLTDLVAPGQRVTAFATLRMAFNAGFAFGPAMAGFLAACGYFWLFAGDAATSVLFGLVALFALPAGAHHRQANAQWSEVWTVLRCDRKLHQMLAANFAIGLVFFQIASAFGLYVTQLGFSAAAYGVLVSLNGALVVLVELPLTTITRRFPARRVMAVGYVVIGAGFALNYFARTVPTLAACMVLFTLGEMITMPMASAYIANLAPAHMRGRYLGVSALTWSLALIFAPGLGMKLFTYHAAWYWLACGATSLAAAGIILIGAKSDSAAIAVAERA
ncbi:MAG: MFS transporter [Verrucomicrobiota bacterium]|jgi:MFS family permease